MKNRRTYFALVERIDGRWGIAFGDFDRETVIAERQDYLEHGSRAEDLCVLKVRTTQAAIDSAVATTNERKKKGNEVLGRY